MNDDQSGWDAGQDSPRFERFVQITGVLHMLSVCEGQGCMAIGLRCRGTTPCDDLQQVAFCMSSTQARRLAAMLEEWPRAADAGAAQQQAGGGA